MLFETSLYDSLSRGRYVIARSPLFSFEPLFLLLTWFACWPLPDLSRDFTAQIRQCCNLIVCGETKFVLLFFNSREGNLKKTLVIPLLKKRERKHKKIVLNFS